LLAVDRLTAGFDLHGRFVPVLIDISFRLNAGETLCLVGESGSGKTMTGMSILRMLDPPARIAGGSIRLEGRELLTLTEREMERIRGARIGMVFQEPSTALSPVFTIGAQIEETLRVHGKATRTSARSRALELLDAVRIPDPGRRIDDYPHQLSGGLKQRALLAQALACDPLLLIADEPTTALDLMTQAAILELLRGLQQRLGLALLLITHDLGMVAEMDGQVAIMYAGRIVEHAPVKELFADPKHPYTRALLASLPHGVPGTRLEAIEGNVPAPGSLPPGCAFLSRCPVRLDVCAAAHPADTLVTGAAHTVKCYLYGTAAEGVEVPV
jgi:oligopeptide/dipeptide ABC transporter ATP-binding protein